MFFFSSRRRQTSCALVTEFRRVLFRSQSRVFAVAPSAQGHHPSPSPACGRRWREAPDEGASAASCSCSCIQQRQTSKAALRFARAPSSALRAPSPVKREKGCISNPPLRFNPPRSEEHTSELQSLLRLSYAVFFLK